VVAEVPPMPVDGTSMLPRISVADRVYPPVDRFRIDGTARPLLNTNPTDLGVLEEIANRRYCWTALHYRDLYDLSNSGYYCQIVVFYRSNLDARYIRQLLVQPDRMLPTPTLLRSLQINRSRRRRMLMTRCFRRHGWLQCI